MEEIVKKMLVRQLGVNEDAVTRDAKLWDDLGGDSLDAIELIIAFEEELGLEIPDEGVESISTVGEIIDYLERQTS
jgi:acyl carrier protein